ncbi:MAG: hypothetical protein OHK0039_42210 [Bacteroidia bacterium]
MEPLERRTGAEKLLNWRADLLWAGASCLLALVIGRMELVAAMGLAVLPFVMWFLMALFRNPDLGMSTAMIMAFAASGLGRYLALPWGLTIDIFLFLA